MKPTFVRYRLGALKLQKIFRQSVKGYLEDNALSRGGAIAYFTIFSIAPVLLIVIAVAGLVFGPSAARGALVGELQGTMGRAPAEAIQSMLASSDSRSGGVIATLVGLIMLLASASGVFGEIQSALNAIWRVRPHSGKLRNLLRARLTSLALVISLGVLLMISLALSAVIGTLGHWLEGILPYLDLLLEAMNFMVSLVVITMLFAAIYKVLPDTRIPWRDAGAGGLMTAILFTIGKTVIGLYIGSSRVASGYGAASALVVVMLWVYYSAQIFLFGAEFTKAYARQRQDAIISTSSGEN